MTNMDAPKQDLRVTKTHRALKKALYTLLEKQDFNKITVNDLCEEALVSRASFYQNFEDKYQLLKLCLFDIKNQLSDYGQFTGDRQFLINLTNFIEENQLLFKHILVSDNAELMSLFINHIEKDLENTFLSLKGIDQISESDKAHISFFTGGLVYLLFSQLHANDPINKEATVDFLEKAQQALNQL